ncbi:MAG: vitamin B12 dependent-methionine synthase activation domain-containing protein [Ignavibacteriales bacterium]
MNEYNFHPEVSTFNLTKRKIVSSLGYEDSPDFIEQKIDQLLEESLNEAKISCGFKIFNHEKVEIKRDSIVIDSQRFDIKKIIGLHLRNAEQIAVFAATIGIGFDRLIATYKEKDLLDTFLIDTIGSELVEMVGDYLEEKLKEIVGDKNISNRLSPGYCGWNISEQQKLFSLLSENYCGISLNQSSLMSPVKSISGIIGIGKNLVKQDYQCKICDLEHCYKRNRNKV